MKVKKIFSLLMVILNLILVLILTEKVQNPKDIRTNIPKIISNSPTILPATTENLSEDYLVTKVIDGDTVELENGAKVRYIGIDTPEISGKKGCFADEAKKKNQELVLGKKVILEKDVSEKDRYGRLLRYVYVVEGDNKQMVNELMVKEGYAQVATFPPDVKFKDLFLVKESEAREANLGLWSRCKN